MSFKKYSIPLSEHQIKQLRKAVDTTTPVKLRLSANQLSAGTGIPIAMTKTQFNRAKKNLEAGKGMMLSMSKTQIRFNKKQGGFLPALIPIGIAVGTAIATGAASAVGTYAVNKIIDALDKDGDGIGPLGSGLAPLGTPIGGSLVHIPGTDLVVRNGSGLFPQGVKP